MISSFLYEITKDQRIVFFPGEATLYKKNPWATKVLQYGKMTYYVLKKNKTP